MADVLDKAPEAASPDDDPMGLEVKIKELHRQLANERLGAGDDAETSSDMLIQQLMKIAKEQNEFVKMLKTKSDEKDKTILELRDEVHQCQQAELMPWDRDAVI